jgi:Rod binding domain-containing protein
MDLSQLSSLTLPGAGLVAADTVLSRVIGSTTNKNSILKNNGSKDAFADILNAQGSKSLNALQLNDGQKSPEKMTKAEAQIRDAARGFERTLIRQMLSSIRNPALRGGDISGMAASSTSGYLEIADDKLADSLVAGKGMGFAQKVAEQMLKEPSVKALIEQEKKAVNSSIIDTTDSIKPISSKTNQYNNIARI